MRTATWAAWVCGVAALVAACGDDKGNPTAATPATTSISVTVNNPLKMGETAQAVGSAARSNGQSQSVTTGWKSDAPAVATVSDAGLVTGVANGRATVYVVADGRQGQQVVRVVPDYHGQWVGGLRVTSCTETGAWAQAEFCKEFPVGSTDGFTLALTQTGESLTARPTYGPNILFTSVTSAIDSEGGAAFSTTAPLSQGAVIETAWRLTSATRGSLSGTVNEAWRLPGAPGEGRLIQNVVNAFRASTASTSTSGSTKERTERLRMRLRP